MLELRGEAYIAIKVAGSVKGQEGIVLYEITRQEAVDFLAIKRNKKLYRVKCSFCKNEWKVSTIIPGILIDCPKCGGYYGEVIK